jgi:hypothetical protein
MTNAHGFRKRSNMENLFVALSFLSLLALPVGMISPKIVLPWSKDKDRKKVLIVYLPTFIISFVLFGITSTPPSSVEKQYPAYKERVENNVSQQVDSAKTIEKANEERLKLEQEAEKQRLAKKAADEAQRKAEEEYDSDGLVLMLKSVKGTRGEFGGEITGIVVNRRSKRISYAQISFNLYDRSGAQIGSAMDNINNLDPGAKWKFKANSFGQDFAKYKFSELSGF